MNFLLTSVFTLLIPAYCFLQPINDNCINAINLCEGQPVLGNNLQASAVSCVGCEDGASSSGNFCFEYNNTVWFSFVTNNTGGDVLLNFSTINCSSDTVPTANNELQGVVIQADVPCDESTYSLVSNCVSGSSNNMNLVANNLNANTLYYVQIDGAQTALLSASECEFTVEISGQGVEQLVEAGEDASIFPGESIALNGQANGSILWSPEESLSDPGISSPEANPLATTTYTITTEINGCFFSDEVTILVQNPLSIPNTITPNDDGFNDLWSISNISNYPNAQVMVFDRWGQQVFKVTGYTQDQRWDGSHNGLRLPSGTYYYVIELKVGGTTKIYNGPISIIK